MSILATASNEPITDKHQLVEYIASAARPRADWLIGCEHEKFPFRLSTLKPVSYGETNGLRELFFAMKDFGWEPILEGENIIGLTRGRAAITFEPGGQVELSGAPLHTLHETSAETDQHLVEINEVAEKLEIGFLGMGYHPTARCDEISWVPKGRYGIMKNYMPKRGKLGQDMMVRTCTVQVNLDFSNEADMVKKFQVGLALQPVTTAMFATSPFVEGKPSGFLSTRMHMWTDIDPDRSGPLPFAFENGFGFERYVDFALDVPMYFVWRDDHYINCAGQSFRDFMKGQLPALPGEVPILTDWANHLTTIFPDVRLKRVIEMRGADVGPCEMMQAMPSFWVGLLYDSVALDAAWDLVKDWTAEDRARLHADVPKLGFQADVKGKKVSEIAKRAITIAQQGLRRRAIRLHGGVDESCYLEILFSLAESSQSYADRMLMEYQHYPDFSMSKLFKDYRLMPPVGA